MTSEASPRSWQVVLAFAIIYLVWGSTFLAIRVGVGEVPPFLLAAMRFVVAGGVLYSWVRLKGVPAPERREWLTACFLGFLIFVIDYGGLFWAERRVPSGIAAVVLATIPVFMAICEIAFLRTQRLTLRLGVALVIGVIGVAVLMNRSFSLGEAPVDRAGAIALIISAMSWSIASAFTRKLPLPQSKAMSAAAQMLVGGLQLLLLATLAGEFRGFQVQTVSLRAWLALAYLIVAGSIVAFTAYLWLLHHESPTKVGTYAYVNPVVAVILGYLLGGESLGLRTAMGTFLVLVSVLVITTTRARTVATKQPAPDVRDLSSAEAD